MSTYQSYYNAENGKYQEQLNRLWKLVPMSGNSPMVAGEMVRAAVRLSHEYYNNGMGNNVSGAINYLKAKGVFDGNMDVFKTIYDYSRGKVYNGVFDNECKLTVAIERMMDLTLSYVIGRPDLEITENSEDMFDYAEPDINYCECCHAEITSENESMWYSFECIDCSDESLEDEDDEEE